MTSHSITSFVADPAHVSWFGARVLALASTNAPGRVLDIGCGDGALLLHLAAEWPGASLMGVDLSDVNVNLARERIASSPFRSRVTVCQGDYLAFDAGQFNLVVASSSLQGMPAPTAVLATKLARDVAAGGVLVHVTPYRCPYNRMLNAVRMLLRTVRGGVTDGLILLAARTLHPGQPVERLRERVNYMYLVLRHYEDTLRISLERDGLVLRHLEPAPHSSLGQPRHRLAVLEKAGPSRR